MLTKKIELFHQDHNWIVKARIKINIGLIDRGKKIKIIEKEIAERFAYVSINKMRSTKNEAIEIQLKSLQLQEF